MNSNRPVRLDEPASVYIAKDSAGRVLYVGITRQGATRAGQHFETSEWWQYHTAQEIEHYPARRQALARETSLIHERKPPFNKQQNPGWECLKAAYLEEVEPLKYGPKAAFLLAEELGWDVPMKAVKQFGPVVRFEVDQAHLAIAGNWIVSGVGVHSEDGHEIGRMFSMGGAASGRLHDIGFDEIPEEMPSCCRVRVQPYGDRGRFRVVAVQVSWRQPAPWLQPAGRDAP